LSNRNPTKETLAATLNQANHDRKHTLCYIWSTKRYILHIPVLLECCYIKMESSQWEKWNHLFSGKKKFNRTSLSISRWRARYEADLVASVVSFISSSTVKMWTTTVVGKYQPLVGKVLSVTHRGRRKMVFWQSEFGSKLTIVSLLYLTMTLHTI
jgi:hypothetical protein